MTTKVNRNDAVARRVRALLAKTVENGATEDEAIAAAEKARELMDKHRLGMTDIEVQDEEIGDESIDRRHVKRSAPADGCTSGIGKYCGVRIWFHHADGRIKLRVFGLQSDVEMARYLYAMIDTTIHVQSEAWLWKTPENTALSAIEKRNACWSHQIGMAQRINERLLDMARAADVTAKTSDGTALVVVKDAVVATAFAALNLHFKGAMGQMTNRDAAAYGAGRSAGDKVNLSRPVGVGAAAKRIG